MCESSAYLIQNGKEELILENVEELYTEGNIVKIVSLFGDQKSVDAEIKQISFVDNKIFLKKRNISTS